MSQDDSRPVKGNDDDTGIAPAEEKTTGGKPAAKKAPRKRAGSARGSRKTPAAPPAAEAAVEAAVVPEAAPLATGAAAIASEPPAASDAMRPEPTPAERPLLLQTELDVRWGDMDAFNHVNNSVFLTYLEEARLRWLQALAGPWLDDNTAPLLAAANVNYRRPIEWPARLEIELYAERVGNSSLTLGHRVLDSRDRSILYSDGHTVLVWIDRRNGKGSRLPAAVRQACAGVRRDRGDE